MQRYVDSCCSMILRSVVRQYLHLGLTNQIAFSVIFNFESELLDLAASAVLNYEKIRKYSTPASHYAGLKIGDKLFVSSGNPKKRQQL